MLNDLHASDDRDVRPPDDLLIPYLEARCEALSKRIKDLEGENQALRLELMRDREAQAGW